MFERILESLKVKNAKGSKIARRENEMTVEEAKSR